MRTTMATPLAMPRNLMVGLLYAGDPMDVSGVAQNAQSFSFAGIAIEIG
jgi:hypothetical protein